MARLCVVLFLGCTACSVGGNRPDAAALDAGPCESGRLYCQGDTVVACIDGARVPDVMCTDGRVCADGLGCVVCQPGYHMCQGPDLYQCVADGSRYEVILTCTPDQLCIGEGLLGLCGNACDEAEVNRSNIGCEYWAVDLDNEFGTLPPPLSLSVNAYNEQFAVAIANPSSVTATVTIFANDAQLGEGAAPRQVFRGTVPPRDLIEIPLDQREVDGPPGSPADMRGTYMSPNAYRITSNYPVVAYQFNPIIQSYSNDASLLIPTSGLDTHYRVLNWPTANPIDVFGNLEGIPDHSYVTIIGVEENTRVSVTLGTNIVGDNFGGEVSAHSAGEVVEVVLGPYEVLNLESDGIPGDMTGTVVESDRPVAVFSGGERAIAPGDTTDVPAYPGGAPEDWCCTEHLEEQVFPTTSWGSDFVITRSPQRGATWAEPDIYRVMADRQPTTITTTLTGASASFTLQPGEWREFASSESFIMRADHPVSIEQIQVSQQWVVDWKPDHGGDPSMLLFPPYQQYRESYVFLTPSTFSADYVVVSAPIGTSVLLDSRDINGDEFDPLCNYEMVGDIDGVTYQAITCPVVDGAHTIDASAPVGIMVYGYYNVGSYGYVGGSDLERINPLI